MLRVHITCIIANKYKNKFSYKTGTFFENYSAGLKTILTDLTGKIKNTDNYMKRGIIVTLLSAIAGGLTAFGVVKFMSNDNVQVVCAQEGAAQFRTVSLSQDNYPDFTYAAETCVDAVVYVKVSSTQTIQQGPGSILDFS